MDRSGGGVELSKRVTIDSLTMVACRCQPGESLGGGRATPEYHDTPRAATLAVKRHTERIGDGGHPYWSVNITGSREWEPAHVTSVVLDGLRWGGEGATHKAMPA